ncbi:hypothetical protein F1559_002914 [Cyanidiococcus yangmingshanensis]|uniref:Uncharacterized protein n=1 Tax=Cyanidiococcus yangmingshanensis TaxID=2690220 RepID=A0A7J7IFG9_9RHOD|nr:hypothetical protein F1559_002914 [Cyanidiococcus yangmingshanensis]
MASSRPNEKFSSERQSMESEGGSELARRSIAVKTNVEARVRGRPRSQLKERGRAQERLEVSSMSPSRQVATSAVGGTRTTSKVDEEAATGRALGSGSKTGSPVSGGGASAQESMPAERASFASFTTEKVSAPGPSANREQPVATQKDPMARALLLCKSPHRGKPPLKRLPETNLSFMKEGTEAHQVREERTALVRPTEQKEVLAPQVAVAANRNEIVPVQNQARQNQVRNRTTVREPAHKAQNLVAQETATLTAGKVGSHGMTQRPSAGSSGQSKAAVHAGGKSEPSDGTKSPQRDVADESVHADSVQAIKKDSTTNNRHVGQSALHAEATQAHAVQGSAGQSLSSVASQPAPAQKSSVSVSTKNVMPSGSGPSSVKSTEVVPQKVTQPETKPKTAAARETQTRAQHAPAAPPSNATVADLSHDSSKQADTKSETKRPSAEEEPLKQSSASATRGALRKANASSNRNQNKDSDADSAQNPGPASAGGATSRPSVSRLPRGTNAETYYAAERLGHVQFSDQWQLFFDHDKQHYYPIHFAILPAAGDETELRDRLETDDQIQQELRELVVTTCRLPVLPPRFVATPSLLIENVLERRENLHGLLAGKYALWKGNKRIPLAKFWYTFRVHRVLAPREGD